MGEGQVTAESVVAERAGTGHGLARGRQTEDGAEVGRLVDQDFVGPVDLLVADPVDGGGGDDAQGTVDRGGVEPGQ